jgi:hypothetical protein
MGLFGKKKEFRFETITIDREREVFRALEDRGWSLCTDPFTFDEQKPAEKIRKDALKTGKDLDAELMVEVFDPLYARTPWKALKYAAWRKATPEEIRSRMAQKMARPSYSDTMSSYEEIETRLDQKKVQVSTEEIRAFDSVVKKEDVKLEGETYGSAYEDMGMIKGDIQAIRSRSPFESILAESQPDHSGPVFESGIHIETGAPDSSDPTTQIDPLALMMAEAEKAPAVRPGLSAAPAQPLPQPGQLTQAQPPPSGPQVHRVGAPAQQIQTAPQQPSPQNVQGAKPADKRPQGQ